MLDLRYSQACTRRNGASIALGEDSYPRMPFALAPIASDDDRYAQRTTVSTLSSSLCCLTLMLMVTPLLRQYLNLIRDDGTINSLEEVDDGDDDA